MYASSIVTVNSVFLECGQTKLWFFDFRCVEDHEKPFALGIQWVFIRLLGKTRLILFLLVHDVHKCIYIFWSNPSTDSLKRGQNIRFDQYFIMHQIDIKGLDMTSPWFNIRLLYLSFISIIVQ